jgi:hypothetical protein
MRLFGVILGIAGWFCSSVQLLETAMAQTPACTVTSSAPSPWIPVSFSSFGAMPQAVKSASDSYFQVSCPGSTSRSGSLVLSILSSNSNTYNGIPKLQVSRADGMFTNSSSGESDSFTVSIPATNGDNPTGKVYYQVLVTAPTGKVLRAEKDYAVTIKADLMLN